MALLQKQLQDFMLYPLWPWSHSFHKHSPWPLWCQSVYWGELEGISRSLLILPAVCNKYHIQAGCISIALDEQSELDSASQKQAPKPQQPDFDLLSDMQYVCTHMG